LNAAGAREGFFGGFIDEVRFWNYARPAAVIAADRWATSFGDARLLARFAMSEGSGLTIASTGSLPPIAGMLTGATWTVGRPVPAHALPAISLNASLGTVASGQPVLLTAAPGSTDGAVTRVEFFAGSTNAGSAKLGEALSPPWTQTFTPPSPGQWTLVAVATSEFGEKAASNLVSVVAGPPAGDGAVYFDGVDDFAELPASAELAPPAFTVETWFRRDGQGQSVGGVDAVPLVALGRATTFLAERSHYLLGIDPGTNRLVGLVNGGGPNGVTPIQNGVWYHAALTSDGTSSRLYLNGVLEGSSAAAAGVSVATPSLATTLDARGVRQGQFHGALDEVRIWSFARTAAELSANAARKIHNAPRLIARWDLDETAGTAIGDSGSLSLSGTLRGGAARTAGVALTPNAPPAIALGAPAPDATGLPASVPLSANVAGEPGEPLTAIFLGRQIARDAEDFTVAILPDTVNYTGGAPQMLTTMLDWVAANREARNIAFVTHTGSVVDASAANAPDAWLAASENFARIEDPVATALPQGLPFGLAAGPRDLPVTQPGYNQFFGRPRFAGRSWFAGSDVLTSNANHLELFSAGGVDFAVAHIAYDATLSNTSPSLVWLKTMLARYRDRQFIVVTHDLLAPSAGVPYSTLGAVVYNAIANFNNVVLLLGGSTLDELRRVNSLNGYSLAANYSGRANGGDGWMRLLEFSPAAGRIHVRTYSPTRGEYETDNDSDFTLRWKNPIEPPAWTTIASIGGLSDGATASATWGPLEPGRRYEWFAQVSDGTNTIPAPARRFKVAVPGGAQPPSVALTAPVPGASAILPAAILVSAAAASPDDAIERVEFFANGIKVARDTAAPFGCVWLPGSAGSYVLTARATDRRGLWAESAGVSVAVTEQSGAVAPVVSITSPFSGAILYGPGTATIFANATVGSGTVDKVDFLVNGALLATDSLTPYSAPFDYGASGTVELQAIATSSAGTGAVSDSVFVNLASFTSISLLRQSYLQMPAPTGMTLRWRTGAAVRGGVWYGSAPDTLTAFAQESVTRTDHELRLTGLTPSTRYYYGVGGAPGILSANGARGSFVTPPPAGRATNARIWALGDSGEGSSAQAATRDAYYAYTGTRPTDFMLLLGDNAYDLGNDTDYQSHFFNFYAPFLRNTPVWSTLGNHDTGLQPFHDPTYAYYSIFNFPKAAEVGGVASGTEQYYSFDYANIHFVCLDSMTSIRSSTGAMANWLRSDLAAATARWIIAYWHHPPYSKGGWDSDTSTELVEMRTAFVPILEQYGVDLVLNGHSHNYERSWFMTGHTGLSTSFTNAMKKNAGLGRPATDGAYVKNVNVTAASQGTVYCVTGNASDLYTATLNHPAIAVAKHLFGTVVLDVRGNQLDLKMLTSTGAIEDSFTMIKAWSTLDGDNDGLPNDFEREYGLNPSSADDALADADGDGQSNLAEFRAGTDARDPASKLTGTLSAQAGGFVVRFDSIPGVTYEVQRRDDLTAGLWTTIATRSGTGAEIAVSESVPAGTTRRFYRVRSAP
jgi:hypothetical protein